MFFKYLDSNLKINNKNVNLKQLLPCQLLWFQQALLLIENRVLNQIMVIQIFFIIFLGRNSTLSRYGSRHSMTSSTMSIGGTHSLNRFRRRETEPELLGLHHSDIYESTSYLVRSPSNASNHQNRFI